MFLGLFLRNGNDGYIQAAADRGSNVFEPDTLFGDGVVPGARCAVVKSKQVEARDIRYMRGRPAVLTLADVRRDSLCAGHSDQGSDETLLYDIVHLRQAHHRCVNSTLHQRDSGHL
jgi:hypothetical protein